MLNAAVNRDPEERVKCICSLANDKIIVHKDLQLIVKIVDNMDKRWSLWQFSANDTPLNQTDLTKQLEESKETNGNASPSGEIDETSEPQSQVSDSTASQISIPCSQIPRTKIVSENNIPAPSAVNVESTIKR